MARAIDVRSAAALGLDAYMDAHRLDAVLFAGRTGAAIAAKAGYPSVQVPAGFHRRTQRQGHARLSARRDVHRPCLERTDLLRLAYAFEQASQARRPPPGYAA